MKHLFALAVSFVGVGIFLFGDKQTGFNTILAGFAMGFIFSGVTR